MCQTQTPRQLHEPGRIILKYALEATGDKLADAAGFVVAKTEPAVTEVGDKLEDVGDKTKSGVREVGDKAEDVGDKAKTVGSKTAEDAKTVGKKDS